MPPPKTFGRDRSIGQTVTIRKGPYKGLLGIVKEASDTNARVELHTKNKTVNVPKDALAFKDKLTGQEFNPNSRGGFGGGRGGATPRGRGGLGSATPGGWDGGRTPGPSGGVERTPAWGSARSESTISPLRFLTNNNSTRCCEWRQNTSLEVIWRQRWRPHPRLGRWFSYRQPIRRQPHILRWRQSNTRLVIRGQDSRLRNVRRFRSRFKDTRLRRRRCLGLKDTRLPTTHLKRQLGLQSTTRQQRLGL